MPIPLLPLLVALSLALPASAAPSGSEPFAAYQEMPVKTRPGVTPYKVAPGLANVFNRKQFDDLGKEALARLEANAFVVTPGWHNEFFPLYEENRYDYTPSFVTVDSILHNYHLLFAHVLREVERGTLLPEVKALVPSLLMQAQGQEKALAGTPWADAATRNVGFLSVAARLLDPKATVPDSVRAVVEQELALIQAHQGIAPSPLMSAESGQVLEDYSQYVPRGHYELDPRLQPYFRAMMWLGRITFRVKSTDETRSAFLLTSLLARSEKDAARWERLFAPITFFVGRTDDPSYPDYRALMLRTHGGTPSGPALLDEKRFQAFRQAAAKLPPPRINTVPILNARMEPNRDEAIQGFRLMGQRFTIDAAVMQRLVYRDVGNKKGTLDPEGARYLPRGLDVPAAFGSEEAYKILDAYGDTQYFRYAENMKQVRAYVAGQAKSQWTQNLYWAWLYSLRPLLEPKGAGYPAFMRGRAWTRKDLSGFLGSWAELKHDTILYAKQVIAEMGGEPPKELDDRGYVEPQPEVYARLAALTSLTRRGLEARRLLGQRDSQTLAKMEAFCLRLKEISEKELRNQTLTEAEYDFIRRYGGELEHFWLEALRDLGVKEAYELYEHPVPVIADVATDPGGRCLEVGVGKVDQIWAVVPVAGRIKIARGAVFSYYEFAHPTSDRLTDTRWREMLDSEKPPARPSWTRDFIVPKGE